MAHTVCKNWSVHVWGGLVKQKVLCSSESANKHKSAAAKKSKQWPVVLLTKSKDLRFDRRWSEVPAIVCSDRFTVIPKTTAFDRLAASRSGVLVWCDRLVWSPLTGLYRRYLYLVHFYWAYRGSLSSTSLLISPLISPYPYRGSIAMLTSNTRSRTYKLYNFINANKLVKRLTGDLLNGGVCCICTIQFEKHQRPSRESPKESSKESRSISKSNWLELQPKTISHCWTLH